MAYKYMKLLYELELSSFPKDCISWFEKFYDYLTDEISPDKFSIMSKDAGNNKWTSIFGGLPIPPNFKSEIEYQLIKNHFLSYPVGSSENLLQFEQKRQGNSYFVFIFIGWLIENFKEKRFSCNIISRVKKIAKFFRDNKNLFEITVSGRKNFVLSPKIMHQAIPSISSTERMCVIGFMIFKKYITNPENILKPIRLHNFYHELENPNSEKWLGRLGINFLKYSSEFDLPVIKNPNFMDKFQKVLENNQIRLLSNIPIGSGNKAHIFKGFLNDSIVIAIKLYNEVLTSTNSDSLFRESKTLEKFSSPYIVKYYWHFTFDFENSKFLILIEEFVDGKTVEDYYNTIYNLDRAKKIQLIIQLVSGIIHFQEKIQLHGDLHAKNVMVTADKNQIKILDPGFSEIKTVAPYILTDDDRDFILWIINKIFTINEKNQLNLQEVNIGNNFQEILEYFESM